MVRALAEQGFTGGIADLRRGQLAQFWMAGPNWLEALTRSLVEGYARSGGRLGEGVLELAAGRHFNIQPNRRPLPPYSEAEWQRLTAVCRQQVDDSYGRSPPRTRPDPRRTGDTADAQEDGRVGDGLSAWRCPRSKTAPQTYRCGDHGRLCGSTGRCSSGVAGRGQQARGRPQTPARAGRVPQLSARHPARRPRRPQPYRLLRHRRRRPEHRIDCGTEDPAQRPGHPQPAVQTRQGATPRPRELLLVHRPLPRALPQTCGHPDRGPPDDRYV